MDNQKKMKVNVQLVLSKDKDALTLYKRSGFPMNVNLDGNKDKILVTLGDTCLGHLSTRDTALIKQLQANTEIVRTKIVKGKTLVVKYLV
jgi:hypothetical protein